MNVLEKIPFNQNVLYQDGFLYYGENQKLYFQKSILPENDKILFYLKSYILKNSNQVCQGYIYFYLNPELKSSDFIGIYVKPEYRNTGLASFLVAHWIRFCFENGYNFLGTNKVQRKPFLIYLLKTYGFEILNPDYYKLSMNTIDICKSHLDFEKYLLFKNPKQAESFSKGKIVKEDNYHIITELSPDMSYLDSILLSYPYNLVDYYRGEEKANLVIRKYKK